MSIHRLPLELLTQIIESNWKPSSTTTYRESFFKLRLVCKTFDTVVLDTLLNNLKRANLVGRLPDGILRHILFLWVGQARLTDDLLAGLVDSATNIILSVLAKKEDDNKDNDKHQITPGDEQIIREKYWRILCDAHIAHLRREMSEPTRGVGYICQKTGSPLTMNDWRITHERANNTAMAAAVHAGDAELLRLLLEADTAGIKWGNTHFGYLATTAVRSQDETLMSLLVDNDVDVFVIENNEPTPLEYMARFGCEKTIRRVVESQRPESDPAAKAIIEAMRSHHPDIAMLLLRATEGAIGKFNMRTLRYYIAGTGNLDVLKVLMEYDPAVPLDGGLYSTPLTEACKRGHEGIVRYLIDTFKDPDFINRCDRPGARPIDFAVKGGHEAIFKLLLNQKGILPDLADLDGQTPLHLAAIHNREGIFKMLLSRADVDINHEDTLGVSALDDAVLYGRENLVKLLIDRDDLDINHTMDGRTPFARAVSYGHNNIVKLLLADPRVNAQTIDFRGKSPLTIAAEHGNLELVKLLVDHPCVDVNSADIEGRTPLGWAVRKGKMDVANFLLSLPNVERGVMNNDEMRILDRAVQVAKSSRWKLRGRPKPNMRLRHRLRKWIVAVGR
ncbi:hypothetical protein FQN50_004173 [Emmonsiellopsis sp. PD_5]|nr:hypothetical protein FQN50_004173 [Emmonsiellopsis sp. PD_5]